MNSGTDAPGFLGRAAYAIIAEDSKAEAIHDEQGPKCLIFFDAAKQLVLFSVS
jgi:tRNA G37 N-methylase Trm5